jgi:signal transduction histidine kinase
MPSAPPPLCPAAPACVLPDALQAALPVFDQLLEFIAVLDDDRRIVYANPAFLRAAGASQLRDVLAQRFGNAVRCAHAAATAGGCGSTGFCGVCGGLRAQQSALAGQVSQEECRIVSTSGVALDFRIRANPWPTGDQRFILVSAIDTSAEQRRRLLERLFFHDLRNTAGGVVGFSEYLAQEEAAAADSAHRALAETIARLSRQLLDEIDSQACLTAAEFGELTAHPQPCDPGVLLTLLRDLYARHDVAEGRQIAIVSTSQFPTIHTDGVLLSRVVGNLLKNALEATRPGGAVRLSAVPYAEGVELRVHNPGVIPPEAQLQIFQRSFSTKGAGRGLGTYGARLIGERVLGGKLSFTSNPTDGTEFALRLPRTIPSALPAEAAPAA